jgi:hypothetical protein
VPSDDWESAAALLVEAGLSSSTDAAGSCCSDFFAFAVSSVSSEMGSLEVEVESEEGEASSLPVSLEAVFMDSFSEDAGEISWEADIWFPASEAKASIAAEFQGVMHKDIARKTDRILLAKTACFICPCVLLNLIRPAFSQNSLPQRAWKTVTRKKLAFAVSPSILRYALPFKLKV